MKKIKLSLSIIALLLGSLACMQSAPSQPAHLPPSSTPAPAVLAAKAEQITEASNCKVNTHALNVRDCAGLHCSVIGWLEAGWTVKAEQASSGSAWIKITRGNLSGFARADYLTCNSGE